MDSPVGKPFIRVYSFKMILILRSLCSDLIAVAALRSKLARIARLVTCGAMAAFCLSAGNAADEAPWAKKELRAGVIGTDTSHVPAFAELFRSHPEWKIKVVAAFKGGSPDLPPSADRLERFATTIREKHNVEIVDSIEELLKKVDVVLLQSLDGRVHLDQ